MAIEVTMPQMGESVVEGTIAKWLVKEGDIVVEDQALVEISTDKVDTEIPSPGAGRIAKIATAEGETVPVGALLAVIETVGAETSAKLKVVAPKTAPKVEPAAEKSAAKPSPAPTVVASPQPQPVSDVRAARIQPTAQASASESAAHDGQHEVESGAGGSRR